MGSDAAGISDVLAPARLGPITLRNRTIKAATFEAASPDAFVTDDLIEYHRRPALGGVGMTTVAYCAVAPEGRTEYGQVWMREEAIPGLRRLTDAIHDTGAAVSAQIGHAGPVANARSNGSPALSPIRFFNPLGMKFARRASASDIDSVIAAHANAARLAIEAGFDAVEIHLGHGYFVSSFLSPLFNRRGDEYGGSLANRAKVARAVVQAVRKVAGSRLAVTAKLTMTDGIRGGIPIEESLQTATWLQEDGGLDALELTAGSSLVNPMYLFRGDVPIRELAKGFPKPMGWGVRLTGKKFFRSYPYHDAFLLEDARRFRAELDMPLILLGGITGGESMDLAMAEGFEFVAMGRALLADPDLVNRVAADRASHSRCTHCNQCMATIFSKTHCVLT
ncbi:Possible oxidoreductase [Mycobacteroides abscessus subsp. bolletii]|uniref:NADH:flavin oxidoreductase n=1 Tax=Mycobacteroides abscessus TaxID=36809 RepID=UPI0009A5DB66|nr:NADH:flavin oxidoreductase [Mycobacteroides abscessus]MDO3068770.1 NADH:flavin oxidoreductase [Mycobacteroides abscessus subsp. bolletii]SKF68958.1 Possible oxidoreductase [Mycobacteroides abscessus subsp. bolletii]SKF69354.1 Possible oxidoreductase [Mycobacteroides abscessus subsp. bolletii]SKN88055.1 oxidoreductase [Mycobacteroides abscessus subsp. bolletii]SKX18534.1 oxidoreductase [Mycobacteroides abscessus subsp. bolletii]